MRAFPTCLCSLMALIVCHSIAVAADNPASSTSRKSAGAVLIDVTPTANDKPVEPFTTTQSKSTPDGKAQKELTLRTISTVFSERARGTIGTFNAKPEERYAVQLNLIKDISKSEKIAGNKSIPVKTLAQPSDLSSIPLHTDATVVNVQSSGAFTFVEVHGKFSVLVTPEATRKRARPKGMYSLVGTPGTKLNLTPLRSSKKGVPFLGKMLYPADSGEALLQITDGGIEVVNITVAPAKRAAAK